MCSIAGWGLTEIQSKLSHLKMRKCILEKYMLLKFAMDIFNIFISLNLFFADYSKTIVGVIFMFMLCKTTKYFQIV